MGIFEQILIGLQSEMTEPTTFGWFHLLWIGLTIASIVYFIIKRDKLNEKTLKLVLAIYGITTFILELLKQISWSYNFDPILNVGIWDYEWYAAPFQLCTTPLYVSLICLFLNKSKIRDSLLSYVAYFTILGGIVTILMPDSCFVEDILVNVHTMFLHCGSLVVSIYLLISKEVKINFQSVLNGFKVFIIFVLIALFLNITFYQFGFIGDETFNMFFISPYFISTLPGYSTIQQNVPYIAFLIFYILSIFLGACLIYFVALLIEKISKRKCKIK